MISSGEADNLEVVKYTYAAHGGHVLPTSSTGAVMVSIEPQRFAVDWWWKEEE